MRISVIIIACNEGPDLEATVTLVRAGVPRPFEIIVVDDCSVIPLTERLASFPDVHILRSETPQGVAPSRIAGAAHASGDVFVFLDAHMRMGSDWLKPIEEAAEDYPSAVFCTTCCTFEHRSRFIKAGATFDRNSPAIGRSWLDRGPVGVVDRCDCLLGACYIVPRLVWDELGGLNPNFYGWGCSEQDLSFRAWMSGFEVRRINELVVAHRFGRENNGPLLNDWQSGYNNLVLTATLFEDGVFEERYWPFLMQISNPKSLELFKKNRPEIMKFREFVQNRRVYSDVELHGLCGFRLPTLKDQRDRVDALAHGRAAKAESQRPEIAVHIPFRLDKNLGRAYDDVMKDSSPSGWVLVMDHDLALVEPEWYDLCVEAIKSAPREMGMITCVTNRIGSDIQEDPAAPDGDDLDAHRAHAAHLKAEFRDQLVDVTDAESGYGEGRCGGFFMLVRWAAWHAVGGFRDGYYVDYPFCDRLRKGGWRIGLMRGLYLYHARLRNEEQARGIQRSTCKVS